MQTNMLLFRLRIIGILILFFLLLDLYSWRGVKALAARYIPKRLKWVKVFYFGLSVVLLLGVSVLLFFPELEQYRVPRTILSASMITVIGAKISFLVFVLIEDLFSTIQWVIRKITNRKERRKVDENDTTIVKGAKISRSQFIYQSGAIVAAAPIYFFTRGAIKDAHNYKIHNITLPSANLPEAFDGMKIVQLSDIHSGSFVDKDAVYKGVKMVMEQKPDVFFFTGDMVNNYAYEMNDYLDVFAPIKAPMGSYSTLGNHDYGDYGRWNSEADKVKNLQNLKEHHKNLNWQLLNNEHIVLDRRGQKLGVIGVENWGSKARFPKYGDMEKAKTGMPDTPYKILLSHDPSHWDSVIRPKYKDVDLMLAGHTHGMQFGIENKYIKFSPVQWMYKQWAGLYTEGNQHLYVNRGYGYIGYPGRVGILPEITVIELKKA
jgi:hypothetical protein